MASFAQLNLEFLMLQLYLKGTKVRVGTVKNMKKLYKFILVSLEAFKMYYAYITIHT